ncbi:hypothetical protein CGRA01v4_14808 [Colletotrichum graminicola]|nr:hypothetical protein CGRA01v4_14808 [Colletotrichum graminicola]
MPGFRTLLRRRHAWGVSSVGGMAVPTHTVPTHVGLLCLQNDWACLSSLAAASVCGPQGDESFRVGPDGGTWQGAGSIASKAATGTEKDCHGGDAGPSSNLRRAPLAPAAKYPGDENKLTGLPRRPGSQGVRVNCPRVLNIRKGGLPPSHPPLHRKSTALH